MAVSKAKGDHNDESDPDEEDDDASGEESDDENKSDEDDDVSSEKEYELDKDVVFPFGGFCFSKFIKKATREATQNQHHSLISTHEPLHHQGVPTRNEEVTKSSSQTNPARMPGKIRHKTL